MLIKFKQGVQIAWITPMCFEYTDGITVSEEEWDEPHFQVITLIYLIVIASARIDVLSRDISKYL